MNAGKFNILTIALTTIGLGVIALPIVIIDPFFHYHAPLNGFGYEISDERHQNNGIVKNFEYDAIITGTSMTENFKTSEMDALFGVNSIKVPYSGGEYREISENLKVALKSRDVRCIIWGLDLGGLVHDESVYYDVINNAGYQYPWYLIDNNPFNDVSYFFNKSIFQKSMAVYMNRSQMKCISFDEAYYWNSRYTFGKDAVLSTYEPSEKRSEGENVLTDEEIEIERENINRNITQLLQKYPDTEFYLFLPPYSICWWHSVVYGGSLNYYLKALQIEFEELLQYDNVNLFAFWNNDEIVCDLNNYKDYVHYSAEVNSKMLHWMAEKNEQYLITKENYLEYLEQMREFYSGYEYERIYE